MCRPSVSSPHRRATQDLQPLLGTSSRHYYLFKDSSNIPTACARPSNIPPSSASPSHVRHRKHHANPTIASSNNPSSVTLPASINSPSHPTSVPSTPTRQQAQVYEPATCKQYPTRRRMQFSKQTTGRGQPIDSYR